MRALIWSIAALSLASASWFGCESPENEKDDAALETPRRERGGALDELAGDPGAQPAGDVTTPGDENADAVVANGERRPSGAPAARRTPQAAPEQADALPSPGQTPGQASAATPTPQGTAPPPGPSTAGPRAQPPANRPGPPAPETRRPSVAMPAPAPSPPTGQEQRTDMAQRNRIATLTQAYSVTAMLRSSLDFVRGIQRVLLADLPAVSGEVLDHLRLQGNRALQDVTEASDVMAEYGSVATASVPMGRLSATALGAQIGETRTSIDQARDQLQVFLSQELGVTNSDQLLTSAASIGSAIEEALDARAKLDNTLGIYPTQKRPKLKTSQRAPARAQVKSRAPATEEKAKKRAPASKQEPQKKSKKPC